MALGTPCSTTELRGRLARSATRRDHCPKLGNVIVRSAWRRSHAIAANCTAYSPFAVRLTNSTARPVSIPRSDRSLRSSSAPNSLARVGAWRWRSSAGWSSAVRSGAHGAGGACRVDVPVRVSGGCAPVRAAWAYDRPVGPPVSLAGGACVGCRARTKACATAACRSAAAKPAAIPRSVSRLWSTIAATRPPSFSEHSSPRRASSNSSATASNVARRAREDSRSRDAAWCASKGRAGRSWWTRWA